MKRPSHQELHIIHCDMDAFFAAVEQKDQPQLRGKPVIVGGHPQSRGVVSTCSYEARAFGVRSAMPLAQAQRLCPHAVFLPVRMQRYQEISARIMEIFQQFTPVVEVLSIDEAFLDVRGCENLFGDAISIAQQIKTRIQKELGLTLSAGISCNKFLAKTASELGKPNGFTVIKQQEAKDILASLPIQRLWGVGPKMSQRLNRLGYHTIGDLQQASLETVQHQLGNSGQKLWQMAHGQDDRRVETARQRQSIGREITFPEDVYDWSILKQLLYEFADELCYLLRRAGQKAATITIKVRYADFQTITRSQSIQPTDYNHLIIQTTLQLLQKCPPGSVRLIGLSLSHLVEETMVQQSLFDLERQSDSELYKVIDSMRERFGEGTVMRARHLIRAEHDPEQ